MSGPDFAGVLATTDWATADDSRAIRHEDHSFHGGCAVCSGDLTRLSAALHAEVARWLADEGTREVVADAFSHDGVNRPLGTTVGEWRHELATTALAALTTTEQEDDR